MAEKFDILGAAICELGTKESPAGSNRVKYNTWYYGSEVSGPAYPWCMAFVQWLYDQCGQPLPFKTASCGALLRWYRENDPDCIVPVYEAQPGDIVIFDLPGTPSTTDHTGIVEGIGRNTITTIDGNTGVGNDANGGAVMRRTRSRSLVRAVIRPRLMLDDITGGEDMPRYQTLEEIQSAAPWAVGIISKLMERGALNGTGEGLDLSLDMSRMMVINDRMGVYGK